MKFLLLFSVFVIATCGLVYELISSALASYLLGDSITQFSTIIGVYLFSMGIGSYLSRFINKNILARFVEIEFLIGAVGGSSAAILFLAFEQVSSFRLLLYFLVAIIGTLVGCEVPLLMRILKSHFKFKDLVSEVFTYDYVGALLGSLLFPLVLVPRLGLVRSSFMFGMFNVVVALFSLKLFPERAHWVRFHRGVGFLILIGLILGFIYSDHMVRFTETTAYAEPPVYAKSSPYQRIILTHSSRDLRLYLNGNLQFSAKDEYRYHEALVHLGMQGLKNPKKILVLGGGDGLAVRELLKYDSVEKITLVDLDPAVTELFSNHETLKALNHDAFHSPKVVRVHEDAFPWLQRNTELFDFVVVDFPDPSNFSIGKLYSTAFFQRLGRSFTPAGAAVIQSTSPYYARKSFWCIDKTLRSTGLTTIPYHAYIPSFGEWGFILATHGEFQLPRHLEGEFKFLSNDNLLSFFTFPPDMARVDTEVNRLNSQPLVRYFDEEWSRVAK